MRHYDRSKKWQNEFLESGQAWWEHDQQLTLHLLPKFFKNQHEYQK